MSVKSSSPEAGTPAAVETDAPKARLINIDTNLNLLVALIDNGGLKVKLV